MAKPGAPKEGEYVDLPEMEWLKCKIIEAPVEEGEYQGKPRTQVRIKLEVLDDEYAEATVTYWAGFSLHEKSKLRTSGLAEAVTGLTGEELFDRFDTDDLVGKRVEMMGKTHKYTKDGEERSILKPIAFRAVGSGRKAGTAPKPAEAAAKASDDIDI